MAETPIEFICNCRFDCEDPPVYPYVRIMDPTEDIGLLSQGTPPEEKLITAQEITLRYNYPLKKSKQFEHSNKNGFTRKDLIECVCHDYHKIYKENTDVINDTGTYKSQLEYLVLSAIKLNGNGIYDVYVDV